jgi:DNA polymerase III subunit delta'
VPGFDSIIGQRLAVRLLQTFLHNGTLPHALLFNGGAGVGKRKTATVVAMALNCSASPKMPSNQSAATGPCGACRSCRQILTGTHPDVQLVEPQGASLKIDQVRRIIHTLAMKAFGNNQRVIIVAEAHTMTAEAANALLKLLEEPPKNTTLILTAHQRSDLLPTIVSRCRSIRFNPLSPTDLATLLTSTQQVDGRLAESIAALAEGSFTQAKALTQTQWQAQRDWLICASGLDQSAQGAQPSVTLSLAFAAQLAIHKAQIQDLLALLKSWIRDLSITPYHPAGVINRDKQNELNQVRQHLDDPKLLSLWDAVEKAQKDIAAKANLRLTLDIMALSMAGHTAN